MRQHRRILIAVLCLCAMAALGSRPADAQALRPEIKAIEIDAGPGIDANRVRGMLKLRVRDLISDAAIDQALRDLWTLGDIRPPEIERQPFEGGYKLIVHIRKLPAVAAVEFKGTVALDADLLRRQLAHPVGSSTDLQEFDADQVVLEKFYRDRGYPLVKMSHEAVEKDGAWNVTYNIESGPHLALAKVRFEGNKSFDERELSKIMTTQAGGLLTKGKYDPVVFDADLAVIAEYYHARGWLDANATSRIDYDTATEQLFPTVVIEEGPRYRVDQVVVRGSKLFSAKEVAQGLKLKSGDVFSEEAVAADARTLKGMYEKKGHVNVEIEKRLLVSEKLPLVTVEINVAFEGPAAVIERVEIRGNDVTQDHVIRRYITIHPGDPVDPTKLAAVEQRLLNTGYFIVPEGGQGKAVDVFLESGSTPEKKNLVVVVNDELRGGFKIGAMWSPDFGPMGLIELVHRNFDFADAPKDWGDFAARTAFAGGGQQLTIRLAPGKDYSDYRVSWLEPSVDDSDYSVGWDVYHNKWAAQSYDRARTGIEVTGGRRFLDDALSVSLTPGYERLSISNVDKDAGKDIRDATGSHSRHTLNLNATYDRRPDPLDPSSGYVVAVDVTNVGGILGGEGDVVKEKVSGTYYRTLADTPELGRHVLSLSGTLGAMQSTSSHRAPFFERYLAGGASENRLRGFEFGGIGPAQGKNNDHVGGEYLALAGVEYEFPVYKEAVRGVVFTDAGNLGRRIGDLKWSTTRVSVGLGLRIRLFGGQGPAIALDFGFPVKKQATDNKQLLSISVGGTYQF